MQYIKTGKETSLPPYNEKEVLKPPSLLVLSYSFYFTKIFCPPII